MVYSTWSFLLEGATQQKVLVWEESEYIIALRFWTQLCKILNHAQYLILKCSLKLRDRYSAPSVWTIICEMLFAPMEDFQRSQKDVMTCLDKKKNDFWFLMAQLECSQRLRNLSQIQWMNMKVIMISLVTSSWGPQHTCLSKEKKNNFLFLLTPVSSNLFLFSFIQGSLLFLSSRSIPNHQFLSMFFINLPL